MEPIFDFERWQTKKIEKGKKVVKLNREKRVSKRKKVMGKKHNFFCYYINLL